MILIQDKTVFKLIQLFTACLLGLRTVGSRVRLGLVNLLGRPNDSASGWSSGPTGHCHSVRLWLQRPAQHLCLGRYVSVEVFNTATTVVVYHRWMRGRRRTEIGVKDLLEAVVLVRTACRRRTNVIGHRLAGCPLRLTSRCPGEN